MTKAESIFNQFKFDRKKIIDCIKQHISQWEEDQLVQRYYCRWTQEGEKIYVMFRDGSAVRIEPGFEINFSVERIH